MNTETRQITVSGLRVSIVRKAIKNLHLGVYPPNGRVRVAVPLAVSDEAVRLAVVGKLGWIKRQQAQFDAQPRQSKREMVSGESHYFLGRRYRLQVRVVEGIRACRVVQRNRAILELQVRPAHRYTSTRADPAKLVSRAAPSISSRPSLRSGRRSLAFIRRLGNQENEDEVGIL